MKESIRYVIFTIFRNKDDGKMFLLIEKSKLEKEFIYFSYIENGVTDAGFFKGNYRGSKIFNEKELLYIYCYQSSWDS